MLNITELERRWFQYKIKSYIPHIFIIVALFLISILLLFIFSSESIPKNQKHAEKKILKQIEVNTTFVKEVKKEVVPTPTSIVAPQQKDIQKIVLTPSLNFIDKISFQNENKENIVNATIPIIENIENIAVVTPEIKPEIKHEPKPIKEEIPVEENINLKIKKQNTSNDINLVIQRFKKNNNPALSLFIAKKYYELGNFNQAYNYSLITNQLNNNIEESWIIFSKSLVKLNQKEKAIKLLKEYVQYSNSSRAEILLGNILSGKFK